MLTMLHIVKAVLVNHVKYISKHLSLTE